jgi:hypothetical protein
MIQIILVAITSSVVTIIAPYIYKCIVEARQQNLEQKVKQIVEDYLKEIIK